MNARILLMLLLLLLGTNVCGCADASGTGSTANPPAPNAGGATLAEVVAAPIRVAAASDLSAAFTELAGVFERQTGNEVLLTFGSTGLLAKQIREGAPFDVFAAANVSFVHDLVQAKACDASTEAPYARGRVAIWWDPSKVAAPTSVADLKDARFKRIAIANPAHAPYGKAAKEALEKVSVWTSVEPRIVYGENVKQTLQFAETGNTEAAIVALSLVIGSPRGAHLLVDEALHAPIDQSLVVCDRGKNARGGRAFATFVNAPQGREVMKRYGFVLPSESIANTP